MTDPIADMIIRVKNAYLARQTETVMPYSKIKHAIADKLTQLGYINGVEVIQEPQKNLKLSLKYVSKKPIITEIKRVSKPGRRIYLTSKEVKPILSGHGAMILTTSSGVLSDSEARQKGVGGEVICKVW